MQDTDEVARETGTRPLSGRIHLLGIGNVGSFVAHSLAGRQFPPPMTLLLHHSNVYRSWISKKECIAINVNGLDDVKSGFDVNVKSSDSDTWYSLPWDKDGTPEERDRTLSEKLRDGNIEKSLAQSEVDDSTIECAVVTVKANQTVRAVSSISNRLNRDSTILLLQNGMGTIDELNEKVFPDPSNRPHYMTGIFSHGLYQMSPFQVVHTGIGTTVLSPAPSREVVATAGDNDADWAPTTKYLLRTLTLTPPLVAFAETPSSIIQYQLEKLAMNAVINPLTSLMECKNGEILYNYKFTRVMRLLLIEISSVILALPEVQGIPGIEARFDPERLRWMAVQLASKTRHNMSSMLQDMLSGKATEIEYINGYIVRRGEELGIKCVVNFMIKEMVQARVALLHQRESGAVPMDLSGFEDKR